MKTNLIAIVALFAVTLIEAGSIGDLVYQGRLVDGGVSANGQFSFHFQAFSAREGGDALGAATVHENVMVDGGLFVVDLSLDEAVFDQSGAWLEISVRPEGVSTFDVMSPRQLLSFAPVAAHATTAKSVTGAIRMDQLPGSIALLSESAAFQGDVTATTFHGDGSGLTNLPQPSSLSAPDGDPVAAIAVDDQGRVGIGTGTPDAELTIVDNSNPTLKLQSENPSGIGGRVSFRTNAQRGADIFYDGGVETEGLRIDVTQASDSESRVPALFIDNRPGRAGNVGVGTIDPSDDAKLHVVHGSMSDGDWGLRIENEGVDDYQGGMRIGNTGFLEMTNVAGDPGGSFARLSSSGTWTTVSDRRLKRDIKPVGGLLQKALELRPVTFRYQNESPERERHLGFIAQEVEAVLPSLVDGERLKTLNYSGLSVVAIGAIQEQQETIEELERELAVLTALGDRLESIASR